MTFEKKISSHGFQALRVIAVAAAIFFSACNPRTDAQVESGGAALQPAGETVVTADVSPTIKQVIEASIEQTGYTFRYDPSYAKIDYPNGDVPPDRGVCSDVVIRAFRKVGVDLQKEIHLDMKRNFAAYPKKWGLTRPDTNIDHRRVPNLMTYFSRRNKSLPISSIAKDYLPGDVVAWDLGGGVTHIGIVTDRKIGQSKNFQIVHNIGAGAKLEDVLFAWRIIGHYRYF